MQKRRRIATADWTPRRRNAAVSSAEPFVPLATTVRSIRAVLGNFDAGVRNVFVHGLAGSGRSTIAGQVARLWNGPVEFWHDPPPHADPSQQPAVSGKSRRQRSRRPTLRIVDSLTLAHSEWLPSRTPESSGEFRLIVGTTAWWLEHEHVWSAHAAAVHSELLNQAEIAHLINGLTWFRKPNAPKHDDRLVSEIADRSEGRPAEVVRLANQAVLR